MPNERRWLIGCAIGCGCAALLGLASCAALTLYLDRVVRGVEIADESYEALIAASGDVDVYAPPADGVVPEGRLAVFKAGGRDLSGDRTAPESARGPR
jgi:hypothetical protein